MSEDMALVVAEESAVTLGTLHASNPKELVKRAGEMADALAEVVKKRKLASTISGREYVRCEGWTTLGAMLGCTPHEVETVEKPEGVFTSTVEFRRLSDGKAVTRASAECGSESLWAKRDRYARRSMAQTRATGKAGRLAFSWIMVLAGFEATPLEEMEGVKDDDVPTLPGKPTSWDGNGGKPLSEVPTDVLSKAALWLTDRNVKGKNDAILAAINEEMEARRMGEQDGD